MLSYNNIFNKDTLNIFTDASIGSLKNNNEVEKIGCYGYILREENISKCYIERCATNNSSEIKAVYMGIYAALQFKDKYKTINLFSDSIVCINGLRSWIFNWVNNNNILYNSSKVPVANQNTFLAIVRLILINNFHINLYHVKGHVNLQSPISINRAMDVFTRMNNVSGVDCNLISEICKYNDKIDVLTRDVLDHFIKNNEDKIDLVRKKENILNYNSYELLRLKSLYEQLINRC